VDARVNYELGRAAAEAQVRVAESRIQRLSAARLAVALSAIALVVGVVWGHLPQAALWGVGALGTGFIALVIIHSRAFEAKGRAEAALRFHQRGLSRLDGTWRAFPGNGSAYASLEHPYTDDLDIFGPSSLFQLLDATETPFGRNALADALVSGSVRDPGPKAVAWAAALRSDQEAVRELAPKLAWREGLSVEGAVLRADAPDPTPFLTWAAGESPPSVPPFVLALAYALPLLALAVGLGASSLGLPRSTWLLVVVVELALGIRYRESTTATLETVSNAEGGFARYGGVFAAALREPLASDRLARPLGRLRSSGSQGGVVREMAELERIVGFVDARRNEVFRLFIGPVLMWDLHCAVRLERWRQRSGKHVSGWFSALGELEAFASLAGFAFDRPDHAWPEPKPHAELHARGLGHPLIDAARRVGNDVDLPREGTALVVTGSNMSGKSTLLRALGVNLVLAHAGAPVAATEFSFGSVVLATSMRIRDSLDEGVSHFYAELQKLKRVVDLAGKGAPVLFLLDEILHGTNSRERVIGARAVIRGLLSRGALGAVSTHDLGIADLSGALPETVKNVHFEEQVHDDGTMTFDYRLREGTVHSSNALRLMRAIGLDVPLDGAEASPLPDGPTA